MLFSPVEVAPPSLLLAWADPKVVLTQGIRIPLGYLKWVPWTLGWKRTLEPTRITGMDSDTAFNSFPGGAWKRAERLAGSSVPGRDGGRDTGRESEATV